MTPALSPEIQRFLHDNPSLHLGGEASFYTERSHHLSVFGISNIPSHQHHPIARVEFTGIRGPHGTIPLRVLYPSTAKEKDNAALVRATLPPLLSGAVKYTSYDTDNNLQIYSHGGGYTVGSVDEFENGLRLLAEASSVIIIAAEYRLALEWRFPVQLDEYSAIISALQSDFGTSRAINPYGHKR